MNTPTIVLWIYCGLILLVSLAGGWLPGVLALREKHMHRVMSLVAGLMLGVAILHMLPHAVHKTGSIDECAKATLVGLLTMFFMIRVFHVHQHHMGDDAAGECSHGLHHHDQPTLHQLGEPAKPHSHSHDHGHDHAHQGAHSFSWLGLAFGLAVHTMIDGMALGAAVQADATHGHFLLFGLGPFVAVFLHKPLDALSITTTMASAGWSRKAQMWANLGFGLMCPTGAFLFTLGVNQLPHQAWWVGMALAFSAGVFLCIALADLLPEVAFHSQDGPALAGSLLVGIALAWGIGFLEPDHLHQDHPHQHDDHAHPH